MEPDFTTLFQDIVGHAKDAASLSKSTKTLVETVRSMFEKSKASGDPDLKLAIAALADKVSDAALANFELKSEVIALRVQLQEEGRFREDLERYKLTETAAGDFVMVLEPSKANGEPMHSICTTCAQKGWKSILQGGAPVQHCKNCGSTFRIEKQDVEVIGAEEPGW